MELPPMSELLKLRREWPRYKQAHTPRERVMSDLVDVAINETTTALEEAANNFLDKAQIWADFANEGYTQLKTLMAQKNITDEFRREERQKLEAAMRRRESHLVAMEFEGIENGEPIDEVAADATYWTLAEVDFLTDTTEEVIAKVLEHGQLHLASMYDWYRDSPDERIRQAAQCFLGGYAGYLKAMSDMNFRAGDCRDNWELTADKRKELDRLEFEVIGRGYCLLQDALEDRK